MLPKITGTNSNFSSIMDPYKRSFYNKKFSNDLNFGGIQGKRAPWVFFIFSYVANKYNYL